MAHGAGKFRSHEKDDVVKILRTGKIAIICHSPCWSITPMTGFSRAGRRLAIEPRAIVAAVIV